MSFVKTVHICVGAQRSATTWIYRTLAELPEERIPKEKEIDFFRRLGKYELEIEWYKRVFDDATICLDITPEYAVDDESLELIYENLGDKAKILFVIREPVGRLVSAYHKHIRNGDLQCDFDFFVKYNIDNCVTRSLYFPTIKRIEKYYKPTVLVYEDLKNSPALWLRGVNDFFGVKISEKKSKSKFNPSTGIGGFRGILNRIYRLFPEWVGLRKIKESIEKTEFGNRLLYGESKREEDLDSIVRSNPEIMRMFEKDRLELSEYLGRDLSKDWV